MRSVPLLLVSRRASLRGQTGEPSFSAAAKAAAVFQTTGFSRDSISLRGHCNMLNLNITRRDEPTPMHRLILRFLLAFALTLAMRVRFEVGAGLETGSFLIDNLS